MKIPEFKKCCFCVPLRGGLLAWGYIKIIVNTFIIPILAYYLLLSVLISLYAGNIVILLYAARELVTLILFIIDFVATIVFIIGGFKKNVEMIRVFYIYNIGVLVEAALLIVAYAGVTIATWRNTTQNLILFAAFLVTLIVQAYFILLLRSEVIKLKNRGKFKFVNNSPEAQCMIHCASGEHEASKDKEAEVQDV